MITNEVKPAFYIENRLHFPDILNGSNLLGEGVEVGVFQGVFSAWILERWQGKKLYSIDAWKMIVSEEYNNILNESDEKCKGYYQDAIAILKKYGERSQIIRDTSVNASKRFADESLDFAYIDAGHEYEAVKEDIETWWPKIKKLGILAGHDYIPDGDYEFGRFGVQKAVNEFVLANNLQLILSQDKSEIPNTTIPPSWFVVKPGI